MLSALSSFGWIRLIKILTQTAAGSLARRPIVEAMSFVKAYEPQALHLSKRPMHGERFIVISWGSCIKGAVMFKDIAPPGLVRSGTNFSF